MRDVAHLHGEVAGHPVHRVGQVLPDSGRAADLRLAAEVAFGADLAGHPGHLVGERRQLVDHRVHGLLELQHLALRVDGHLACEVAASDRRGDERDVAHLGGLVGDFRSERGKLAADLVGQRADLGEHEPVRVAGVPPVAVPGTRAEIASPERSQGGPDRLKVGVAVPGSAFIPPRAAGPLCAPPDGAAPRAVSRSAVFASFAIRPACPIGYCDG